MSQTISPATKRAYGLKRVCETWSIPRSRIYKRNFVLQKLVAVHPWEQLQTDIEPLFSEGQSRPPFASAVSNGTYDLAASLQRLG